MARTLVLGLAFWVGLIPGQAYSGNWILDRCNAALETLGILVTDYFGPSKRADGYRWNHVVTPIRTALQSAEAQPFQQLMGSNPSAAEVRQLFLRLHQEISKLTPKGDLGPETRQVVFQLSQGYLKRLVQRPEVGSRAVNEITQLHFESAAAVVDRVIGTPLQVTDYRTGNIRLGPRHFRTPEWIRYSEEALHENPNQGQPSKQFPFLTKRDLAGLHRLAQDIQSEFHNRLFAATTNPDPASSLKARHLPIVTEIVKERTGFGLGIQQTDAKFMARLSVAFPELMSATQAGMEFSPKLYEHMAELARSHRMELESLSSPFLDRNGGALKPAVEIYRKIWDAEVRKQEYQKLFPDRILSPTEMQVHARHFENWLRSASVFEGHFHLPSQLSVESLAQLRVILQRRIEQLKNLQNEPPTPETRQKILNCLKDLDQHRELLRKALQELGPRSADGFWETLSRNPNAREILMIDLDIKGLGTEGLTFIANQIGGTDGNPSLIARIKDREAAGGAFGPRDRETLALSVEAFTKPGFEKIDRVTQKTIQLLQTELQNFGDGIQIVPFISGDDISIAVISEKPLESGFMEQFMRNLSRFKVESGKTGDHFRASITRISQPPGFPHSNNPSLALQQLELGVKLAQEANETNKNRMIKPREEAIQQGADLPEIISVNQIIWRDGAWVVNIPTILEIPKSPQTRAR